MKQFVTYFTITLAGVFYTSPLFSIPWFLGVIFGVIGFCMIRANWNYTKTEDLVEIQKNIEAIKKYIDENEKIN